MKTTKRLLMMVILGLTPILTHSVKSNIGKEKGHLVTATKYHPVKEQCYGNPLITADGSRINVKDLKEGKLRWIAISRDLLEHYSYGDTVIVVSEFEEISGKWVIHDTMGPKSRRRIDFLLHPESSHRIPKKVRIIPV